jgi:spermidine/putrescine transport system permease protein
MRRNSSARNAASLNASARKPYRLAWLWRPFTKPRAMAYPYIGWMALFVVAPIVLVVVYAFTERDGGFTLGNFSSLGSFVSVFTRSFFLALVSTVVCLALGYPLAYILAKESARYQKVMLMLIMLPMWMNFLLRTYAWMSILENTGLFNRFLGLFGLGPMHIINTPVAVVIGMVYNFLPFMILPIYSVIVKIDRSLIEAAQDLGAPPRYVFARVIFPLSLPGALSGITMVFVPAVSTFVISQLLGGGTQMLLGELIEMQFLGASYNPHVGSAIALVMMFIVMIFMYVMNKFGEGEERAVIM